MSNILDISIHLKKKGVIIKTSSIIKDFIYLNDKQCEILYVDVIISAIGICPNT